MNTSNNPMRTASFRFSMLAALGLLSACAAGSGLRSDAAPGAERFRNPDAAVQALVDATAASDSARLAKLFGPGSEDLLSSGDEVADKAAAERFLDAARTKRVLADDGEDRKLLQVGEDGWPFPIPLVKTGGAWAFDAAGGREELLNRRVGYNEIHVIAACLAYVDAQRDYAARMLAGRGKREYAQKIRSTPGRRDGLFWEARKGEKESPLGPMFAEAAGGDGYDLADPESVGRPFHGYSFRVLTAQGPNAPGGKKSYLRGAHMNDGFALVAWPSAYGNSGVMTFVVNQLGVVFQKDLGEATGELASKMTAYDPDDSWDPVEPPLEVVVDDADDDGDED